MKAHKIISMITCFTLLTAFYQSHAFVDADISAANFLAEKNVINDQSHNVLAYNLGEHITRREMLKVMMNLSGKELGEACLGKFQDIAMDDWGCKYAESALEHGFIAENANFRPDDKVSQIEALKMIMQARGIAREENEDWRVGYLESAKKAGILGQEFLIFDDVALRSWIFTTSAKSYEDFVYEEPQIELTPEEEELFQFFLDL